MKRRLENKLALVTGSTRGIGNAIAKGFMENGADVIFHGRGGCLTADGNSPPRRMLTADLNDPSSIDGMIHQLLTTETKLDILVHNAAVEVTMPIASMDLDTLDMIWRVNLRSVIQLTRGVLPLLKASGTASIINVTSIHQFMPPPENGAYAMTKAALGMFTQTLAIELAPFGIRVNNLAPGAIATDMNREVVEAMSEGFSKWIPLGRVGSVDEMIGPAVFLASDESSYVTGATLVADGGYSQNLLRYRLTDISQNSYQ